MTAVASCSRTGRLLFHPDGRVAYEFKPSARHGSFRQSATDTIHYYYRGHGLYDAKNGKTGRTRNRNPMTLGSTSACCRLLAIGRQPYRPAYMTSMPHGSIWTVQLKINRAYIERLMNGCANTWPIIDGRGASPRRHNRKV